MNGPQTRQRHGAGRGVGYSHRDRIEATRPFYASGSEPGRRLPPYGREVEQAIIAGGTPNVRLVACRPDPWPLARARHAALGPASVLVLPAGEDPESFRWPALPDLVADVTDMDGDTMHRLARALIRDGVRLAYLLDAKRHERDLRVVAADGAGSAS